MAINPSDVTGFRCNYCGKPAQLVIKQHNASIIVTIVCMGCNHEHTIRLSVVPVSVPTHTEGSRDAVSG